MRPARSGWLQRTTAHAGAALLTAFLLHAIDAAHLVIPLTSTTTFALPGTAISIAGDAMLLVGLLILAFGTHGELDAAGGRTFGRLCLILWAATALAGPIGVAVLPLLGTATAVVLISLDAVQVLAALGAAIAVARARTIVGPTRWALLPLATTQALDVAGQDLPVLQALPAPAVVTTFSVLALLELAALLLAATALLVYGRLEALKHRAATINKSW